jgi:hypothetical protein
MGTEDEQKMLIHQIMIRSIMTNVWSANGTQFFLSNRSFTLKEDDSKFTEFGRELSKEVSRYL